MAVMQTLKDVFENCFDMKFERFDETISPAEVEKWDSTAHVTLLLDIEQAFGVVFTPREMARLDSVGAIRDTLEAKMSPAH